MVSRCLLRTSSLPLPFVLSLLLEQELVPALLTGLAQLGASLLFLPFLQEVPLLLHQPCVLWRLVSSMPSKV